MMNRNINSSTKSLQLARRIAEQGYRLFSSKDAGHLISQTQMNIKNPKNVLFSLKSHGLIHSIKRDLYVLDSLLIGGQPVHEYEIATHLVSPSSISHFSAFHSHKLTDQLPQIVFVTTPTGTSLPRLGKEQFFTYKGVRYHFIQVKKEHFFGIENVWIGDARIPITDLERTLLDGLMKPKFCGGFQEVLSAFSSASSFKIETLYKYVLQLDISTAKRLGWVLEHIGFEDDELKSLLEIPFKGFIKLDPSGENRGPYNKKWQIQENI